MKRIIFIICIGISLTYAQNINDALRIAEPGYSSSARAMGMGNSFLSISDDASAMFFNPAGLGLIKRLELAGGLDYFRTKNESMLFGSALSTTSSKTNLNQFALVLPFPTMRGSLVFGIAFNQSKLMEGDMAFDGYNSGNNSMIQYLNAETDIPYELYLTDTNYVTPINGRLQQSGSIIERGRLNNWVLSAAIEVEKNLFVGANLSIYSGKYTNTRDFFEDDIKGIYTNIALDPLDPTTKKFQSFEMHTNLDWEMSGWDLKLGLLYQFENFSRFGLTLQFPKTITIKESFIDNYRSVFGTGYTHKLSYDPSNVEYDITTPIILAAGGSFNMFGLILSVDATLMDYTETSFENASGLAADYIAQQNKSISNNLRTVVNPNFGIEYTIPKSNVRLRGGYFIQKSPYKDDPTSFDKKYYTGGVGLLLGANLTIELAYLHGSWSTFGDNYDYNVSRTYQDLTVDHFGLSFHYRL